MNEDRAWPGSLAAVDEVESVEVLDAAEVDEVAEFDEFEPLAVDVGDKPRLDRVCRTVSIRPPPLPPPWPSGGGGGRLPEVALLPVSLPIWLSCENQLLLPLMPLMDIFRSFQSGCRQAVLPDQKSLLGLSKLSATWRETDWRLA
jgi:hypothetical protein